jgi:hypothetical protein
MKMKTFGALVALAMLLVSALPAGAATPVADDLGVFFGTATVGASNTCNNNGTAGSALGVNNLGLLTTGNRTYTIDSPASVASGPRQASHPGFNGSLKLCGHLAAGAGGLGASCVTTSGSGGVGKADFLDGSSTWINDLGWTATAVGTFVVQGDVGGASKKDAKRLTAIVQALDENVLTDCVNGVARGFTVAAVYAIQ